MKRLLLVLVVVVLATRRIGRRQVSVVRGLPVKMRKVLLTKPLTEMTRMVGKPVLEQLDLIVIIDNRPTKRIENIVINNPFYHLERPRM